jgi:hypothetical protein
MYWQEGAMERVNLSRTSHYLVRARQRGYRSVDLSIIESLGNFSGDGFLLRKKDVAAELERLSKTLRVLRRSRANKDSYRPEIEAEEREVVREIERLERLPGAFIPIESGHALSIYRPSRRRLRQLLHGGRRRRLDRRYWR